MVGADKEFAPELSVRNFLSASDLSYVNTHIILIMKSLYYPQPPGCRLKATQRAVKWRKVPVIQLRNADHTSAISLASGKRQPMTMQIQNCRSTKFALDLNTGNGNLSEVNKIAL